MSNALVFAPLAEVPPVGVLGRDDDEDGVIEQVVDGGMRRRTASSPGHG